MAMGTSSTSQPPAQQQATPGVGPQPPTGVGQMGAPVVVVNEPAEPVLFPDIDPVLLIRLFPAAKNADEMRSLAMAAGEAVRAAGLELIASQQEPVIGADGEPVPPPPSAPPRAAPPKEPAQAPHK